MKIFNSSGIEILDIVVSDDSYSYEALQQIGTLTLHFSSPEFIELPLGSYVDFNSERYTLEDPENFKKQGERNFEYTLLLETAWAKSKKYKVRNTVDKRLKFDLTAKPVEHLQLIVDNMNLRDSGWSVGSCIDAAEILIAYNHVYCYDGLQSLADTTKTEWEINGKSVSLRRIEYNKSAPLALSYGKGNGFKPGLGRTNLSAEKPVEILYVQGGEKNIDYSKYGSRELLLPKSQQLVYEGRTYVTDADGLSIRRADKPVTFNNEDSLDLSHIYPSRVGTVTEVVEVDPEKNFYDFFDSSIPVDLDFEACLIAGEKMTVIFQSGILAGREFEVAYTHEYTEEIDGATVTKQRRFEIVPQEVDGQTMPNATFLPSVGDTYAVFGISLPDAYVCDNVSKTGASWDMLREGAKYLFEHEDQKFSFTCPLDDIYAKANWINIGAKIRVGGYILFSDTQFQTTPLGIRITGIKTLINDQYAPEIELSNTSAGSFIGSELKKIDQNEVVTEVLHKQAMSFTKRRFRDAKETIGMVENSLLHFSQSIDPIAVRTMALLIGDESLQFEFVDDMETPDTVAHNVTYDIEEKKLLANAGTIQHMTLGIDSLSSSHAVSEYKFWNVALFESAVLEDPAKTYYLYIKASRTTTDATFILSETAIEMEADPDYYHFLYGNLNSEFEGERSFVTMHGFSEFLPGQATIRLIKSPNGKTYFDLSTGVIQGVIKFIAPDGITVKELNQLTAIDWGADALGSATQALADAIAYSDSMKAIIDGDIDDVEASVTALDTYVDGAFHDGVISEAEAKKIQGYINTLNAEKADVDNRYTSIYNNADLSGTPKANLSTAKTAYNTAHTDLISAINTAIADGKTTQAESAAVDTAFTNYSTTLASLSTRFEEAVNFIAYTKAQAALGDANDYSDSLYVLMDALKLNAVINGKTLIVGGYINTDFIDTGALVISGANIPDLGSYADLLGSASAALVSAQGYADTKKAEAIAAAATDATTKANAVNATLTSLSNSLNNDDNVTPVEKSSTYPIYSALLAEKSGLDAQATSFSITTEKTAYDNAITALQTFAATTYSIYSNFTTTTTLSGGDGAVFRTRLNTALTAKQTLLTKIAAQAKALSEATAAADATAKADAALSSAQGYADAFYNALNANKLDAIVNGKTIIINGYLNTDFIEAGSITANLINFDNATGNNVDLTGKIIATEGSIGGLGFNAGYLFGDMNAGIFLTEDSTCNNCVKLGDFLVYPNVSVGTSLFRKWANEPNHTYAARFQGSNAYSGYKGYAAGFEGETKFEGNMSLVSGLFSGATTGEISAKRVSASSYALTAEDCWVTFTGSNPTASLPTTAAAGKFKNKTYMLRCTSGGTFTVPAGSSIIWLNGSLVSSLSIGNSDVWFVIYDGTYWQACYMWR